MQRARELGRAPRELAEELATRAVEVLPEVERAVVAGPGFLNLWVTDAFVGEVLGEIDAGYGGGSAARSRADPGRARLGQPDGAAHGRRGPERRLRRLRRPPARVRRPRGRTRVLLQRRRRPDGPVSRLRRGGPRGPGAARGRLPRRLHRRDRGRAGRPGAADAARDRADAGAVPDPLRLVGAPERARARPGGDSRARSRPTSATGRSSCARRTSATTRTGC